MMEADNNGARLALGRVADGIGFVAILVGVSCGYPFGRQSNRPQVSCPSDMVMIPGGDFQMGSDSGESDERPPHPVRVASFCLERNEVSVAEYFKCVESGACSIHGVNFSEDCNRGRGDPARYPMNCVDWEQARAYCAWQGRRLPSEAEWEYTARGRQQLEYASNKTRLGGVCWMANEASAVVESPGTCKIGEYHEGTVFGVEDLAGNVSEWTSSEYVAYTGAKPLDPNGLSENGQRRVARGGNYRVMTEYHLRTSDRVGLEIWAKSPVLGIRCAKNID